MANANRLIDLDEPKGVNERLPSQLCKLEGPADAPAKRKVKMFVVSIRNVVTPRIRLLVCVILFSIHPSGGEHSSQVAAQRPHEDYAQQKSEAEEFFQKNVTPFIKKYCLDCHSNSRPTEAGVNFVPALKTPEHAAFSQQWKKAVARVKAHDMPPDYTGQPSDEERQRFVEWLGKIKFLSKKDPGPFVIRRLTKTEYGNTLRDLLGVDPSIVDGLPDEVSGAGYLNSLSPLQLEQYLAIAEKVLNALDSETEERLFGDPPDSEIEYRASAYRVAKSLSRKAYRRPPTQTELDVALRVFDLGRQKKLGYQESLRLMLKSVLVSPQFLFITPAEDVESEFEIVRLDDYQLASRLSYLLWATMPDKELLSFADDGVLHQPEILKTQVIRLLNDTRSRALFDGFGAQWLGLGDLNDKVFDPDEFFV